MTEWRSMWRESPESTGGAEAGQDCFRRDEDEGKRALQRGNLSAPVPGGRLGRGQRLGKSREQQYQLSEGAGPVLRGKPEGYGDL